MGRSFCPVGVDSQASIPVVAPWRTWHFIGSDSSELSVCPQEAAATYATIVGPWGCQSTADLSILALISLATYRMMVDDIPNANVHYIILHPNYCWSCPYHIRIIAEGNSLVDDTYPQYCLHCTIFFQNALLPWQPFLSNLKALLSLVVGLLACKRCVRLRIYRSWRKLSLIRWKRWMEHNMIGSYWIAAHSSFPVEDDLSVLAVSTLMSWHSRPHRATSIIGL